MKSKQITIQIEDNQINEQYYSIQIMTNGKETKKIAVFPQVKSLITDNKKQVKVEVVEDVPYTIRVFKTNEKSLKIGKPLAEIKFTPSYDLNYLKIKVNPNLTG